MSLEEIYQRAVSLHQSGQLDEAAGLYHTILQKNPTFAHGWYLSGIIALDKKDYPQAERCLIMASKLDVTHPVYVCCLGHCLRAQNKNAQAASSFQKAVECDAKYTEAYAHLADSQQEINQLEEAYKTILKTEELDPSYPHIAVFKSRILRKQEKLKEALDTLLKSQTANRESVDYQMEHGNVQLALNNLEKAEETYRLAMEQSPETPEVHFNLGLIFERQKKHDWARGAFESCIKCDPTNGHAHLLAAKSALGTKSFKIAEAHLDKTTALGYPDHLKSVYHFILASILKHKKENRKAVIEFQKTIALDAENYEAYVSLAETLKEDNKFERAIAALEKAIALKPNSFAGYVALSAIYGYDMKGDRNGHTTKALFYARKALECNAEDPAVNYNMGNMYMQAGLPHESLVYHYRALAKDIKNPGSESVGLFNSNYLYDIPAEEHYQKAKEWGEKHMLPYLPAKADYPNPQDPERKLRIGYISRDFCVHPVGYFMRPIIENHNHNDFEYTIYSNFDGYDEFVQIFKDNVEHWREIKDLSHEEIANLIKKDQIDILIEVSGHSMGHKLQALAYKPAPVQVSWLAYPNTTGMRAIDYRFSDAVIEPPEHDAISVERIYRLPNGFNCYAQPYEFPDVAPAPSKENGYVSFGCFNNSCKLNKKVFETWAKILKGVPNSKLVLKDKFMDIDETRNYFMGILKENGVDENRVTFLPFSATNKDHLDEYSKMDIALDPFPYNGTTSSCEALTMGVPIISYLGDRHASRVTGSLCMRAGLHDWVGESVEDYIRIAIEKAQDVEALAKLREGLREQVMSSTLYDKKLITKDVENAYRHMWQMWCARPNVL